MFHAGHRSWQRPHSVQEVASRSIFQLPGVRSSSRSGVGRDFSAFAPSALRWKKMLKNAMKRCHMTPHWKYRAMHAMKTRPDRSFTRAKNCTMLGDAPIIPATCTVTKSAHSDPPPNVAMVEALTNSMPRPSMNTMASTKRAGKTCEL